MKPVEKPVILAVDDRPELLTGITGILREQFTVISVTSGKAALKAIEKHTPQLFILDIEMPGMDGYQLAQQLREDPRFKTTPILFLSGKNTRKDVTLAILNGGNDYLLKPLKKDLLLEKIRNCLR